MNIIEYALQEFRKIKFGKSQAFSCFDGPSGSISQSKRIKCHPDFIWLKSSYPVKYSNPKTKTIELMIYTFCMMAANPK